MGKLREQKNSIRSDATVAGINGLTFFDVGSSTSRGPLANGFLQDGCIGRSGRMTTRHAAAFALVGWYLMIPPQIPNSTLVNNDVPLAQWKKVRTFPHSEGCEAAKSRAREQALAHLAQIQHGRAGDPQRHCPRCFAECVKDDDPRLTK